MHVVYVAMDIQIYFLLHGTVIIYVLVMQFMMNVVSVAVIIPVVILQV